MRRVLARASANPACIEITELNAALEVITKLYEDGRAIGWKLRVIEHKAHQPRARKAIRMKRELADVQQRIERACGHQPTINLEGHRAGCGRGVMRAIFGINVGERHQDKGCTWGWGHGRCLFSLCFDVMRPKLVARLDHQAWCFLSGLRRAVRVASTSDEQKRTECRKLDAHRRSIERRALDAILRGAHPFAR